MDSEEETRSLEYTPTWIVASVCSAIVLISLCVERVLHRLGKFLKHKHQDALFEALEKLKEELMLLGFISLLLTVFQGLISHICIPVSFETHMLPCKRENSSTARHEIHYGEALSLGFKWKKRRLLFAGIGTEHCRKQGKVSLLSLEALHQLHIFIFVLAVVHVAFCATTMVLGGAKIRQWKHWEDLIREGTSTTGKGNKTHVHHHHEFVNERAVGFWTKSAVVSWMMSFFKQFYASVTLSDYSTLRSGFIMAHCPSNLKFDFHKYMMRALEADFKKVVGISWYLWLFVVIFLLLNIDGWHTYFWLSFVPLILLLIVGAKLEHVITRMAQEVAERDKDNFGPVPVKLSDKHFWFGRPGIILYLIHFILFQNSFEIAFFFWIWSTYGFDSCIMEKVGYIVPRLIIGVIIQVLCSYSTLPLYAIVTQMGSMFKRVIFEQHTEQYIHGWAEETRRKRQGRNREESGLSSEVQMQKMAIQVFSGSDDTTQPVALEGTTTQLTEHPDSRRTTN